jgi:GT2 family glycosyltransferase
LKLSIVIVNYNVRYFLELCLHSVKAAIEAAAAEIIVVDNASLDDSCQMVKTLFPEVILIENKENLGFSKANNIGVRAAKGEFICILNPDTVVVEHTFSKLISFAENQENLGVIGCKLIDGTGKFLPESKRNLPVVKVALQKMRGNATNYYANHIGENEIAKVEVLVGAFMVLKSSVFNELGGFDEDYFMYGEDIDLSYKATKMGLNNFYYGATTIIHYKGESTLKDSLYAKRFYGAMQIFYKKHFKSNILFDTLVWIGIKLAYFVRREPKTQVEKSRKCLVFSNKCKQKIKPYLREEVKVISKTDLTNEDGIVVFDTLEWSFKSIIDQMCKYNTRLNYRILVSETNFLLGSDSSNSRGEVVEL